MTRQLHLLVVNVLFAPNTYGGATHVAEQVAAELVRRHDVRVTAVSAMSRAEYAPYAVMKAERDGIVNHLINLPASRSPTEIYNNPLVAERVSAIVRDCTPDLAHVHCVQDIGANLLTTLQALALPVVLSIHDFWWLCERQFMIRPDGRYCGQDPINIEGCRGCVSDFPAAAERHHYLGRQAATADLVTYPSRFALDLCERSGLAPDHGVVWPNGIVPPAADFAVRQKARRDRDPRVAFGFVGGPSPIKGWPIIQDAFRALGRDDCVGYLVDASLDGSWYPPARYAGMRGDWRVHPRYDAATADNFYAKIDVLLFLSQWKETFGLTIREALARGIQVIQTDGGGTVDHNGRDRVRFLAIGDGPRKLLAEIERLLDAPELARPDPLPQPNYGAQAHALMRLLARHDLLPARSRS